MEVVKLSAADTGLIILIGQIVDALTSVISGYLGDMVKVPVLSQKIGMRKSWYLMATVATVAFSVVEVIKLGFPPSITVSCFHCITYLSA